MADPKGGPELSWQTVVGALTAVGLLGAAQWAVFQTQFANVVAQATADRVYTAELKASLDKYFTIREQNQYRDSLEAQLTELRRRAAVLEQALARAARDPVEQATFQAVSKATDDRVTLLQNQLNDVNRQIAAALVIIDQNRGRLVAPATLPP
jgi:hypothetical protein